jgi:hypothetical protein
MKKFLNWIKKNQDVVLRMVYSIPVILAVVVSINHAITWFEISNPSYWSVFLSISVEIVALTTLVALILGKNTFSVVSTFAIITIVQILGNIFFSFNYISEDSMLFQSWVKFVDIIFTESELTMDKHKFYLATIQGSVVPLLSLLSIHLIYSLKLKEDKIIKNNVIDTVVEKTEIEPIKEEFIPEPEVVKEEIISEPVPVEKVVIKEEFIPEPEVVEDEIISEPEPIEKVVKESEPKPIKRIKIPKRVYKPDVVEISHGEFIPVKEDTPKPVIEEEPVVEGQTEEQLKEVDPIYYEDMGQPVTNVNKKKGKSFLPRVKINNRK